MVDEWSPGSEPQSTEFPKTETSNAKALFDRLSSLKNDIVESTSNLLRTAGIFLTKAGMRIGSSLTVEGDLASTGSASFGGNTTVTGALSTTGAATFGGNTNVTGTFSTTGAATFGGNTSITGTLGVTGTANIGGQMNVTGDAVFSGNLAVPNGSITNAALASPVSSAIAAPGTSMGWAVNGGSGVFQTKASTSIPVPAGYSRALVFASASATYQSPSSSNRFDIRAGILGEYGAQLINLANLVGSSSVSHTRSLTGLNGGAITLECQVATAVNEAAQAANTATVTGFAIFFR